MHTPFRGGMALLVVVMLSCSGTVAQNAHLADSVKAEFLHAWNGYKLYAWGHDDVRPLSHRPHDWFGRSLVLTPVDAFDTMVLMGLKDEAAEDKQLIIDSLSFDRDTEVQAFEIAIRLLGGLLAAYELDGDPRFLHKADDLGRRLLPIFRSSTGLPYRYVNLQSGAIRDSINNPAEIGTLLLEFGTLTRLTHDTTFYVKAKNAVTALFRRRSPIGLVGTWINSETGEWVDTSSHIDGAIDSYYEYLLKAAILFHDAECREMWDVSVEAINRYLADSSEGRLWYGEAGMTSGIRIGTRFGALQAFFPAVLCLAGDTARAARLEESCFAMWNLYGIEPEEIDYRTMKATASEYHLRPEIIESAYYLFHYTHDQKYQEMGETFFRKIRSVCRTKDAYAEVKNVATGEQADAMQSFFLAETLKYLYLLFAPETALSFDTFVFNTEAHPFRR
jgi:mannosidase alpha-like ER degradation enhancer 2